MIAYCPLEDLEPPVRPKQPVVESKTEEVKPLIGREETELNYVIMAFIAGVIVLAVSDTMKA
jgi:hypothetical protein